MSHRYSSRRGTHDDRLAPQPAYGPARHEQQVALTLGRVSRPAFSGTCWYLSNGFQPGERVQSRSPHEWQQPVHKDAGANNPAALQKLREDKSTGGNGLPRPKLGAAVTPAINEQAHPISGWACFISGTVMVPCSPVSRSDSLGQQCVHALTHTNVVRRIVPGYAKPECPTMAISPRILE